MGPAVPKTLDDIYNDYLQRREGLLTALIDGSWPRRGCTMRQWRLGPSCLASPPARGPLPLSRPGHPAGFSALSATFFCRCCGVF